MNYDDLVDGQMKHRVNGISIIAQVIDSHIHGYDYKLLVARCGFPTKQIVFTFGHNDFLAYHYAKEKLPQLSEREVAEFMILMRDWVGLKIGESPAFDLNSDPTDLKLIEDFWEAKQKAEREDRERNSYIY